LPSANLHQEFGCASQVDNESNHHYSLTLSSIFTSPLAVAEVSIFCQTRTSCFGIDLASDFGGRGGQLMMAGVEQTTFLREAVFRQDRVYGRARQEVAENEVVEEGDLAYRSRDGAPLWSSRMSPTVMAEDDDVRMGRNSSEDR
jgi:hypothetical protein